MTLSNTKGYSSKATSDMLYLDSSITLLSQIKNKI